MWAETFRRLDTLLDRVERLDRLMSATREDLDGFISGLPVEVDSTVESSVEKAVQPIIASLITKQNTGEDYTAEITLLKRLSGDVAGDTSDALAAWFRKQINPAASALAAGPLKPDRLTGATA